MDRLQFLEINRLAKSIWLLFWSNTLS